MRHTQFARASYPELRRCKMYLLLNRHTKKLRGVLEFDKEVNGDVEATKIACVLSESGKSCLFHNTHIIPTDDQPLWKLKCLSLKACSVKTTDL